MDYYSLRKSRLTNVLLLFFAVQLFTIIPLSPTLKNVMRAVTIPGSQLSMTAFLGLIIIYTFSTIGFYFFKADMENDNDSIVINECTTLLMCLKSFVRNGIMSGGGIGDYISGTLGNAPSVASTGPYAYRLVFDLLFFVIVIVLLLNIIFGIIIDTFGSLREQQNEKVRRGGEGGGGYAGAFFSFFGWYSSQKKNSNVVLCLILVCRTN